MSAHGEAIRSNEVLEDGDRANVLIVDDRPDKLLVFKTILDELGQNIISFQSGENALRWLLDNECAVMLLDVNMPGMDGFELAQLVRGRQRSAHTPIIFVTASPEDFHTTKGYALGAVDYLPSPAIPIVLRSKVKVFVQLFNLTRQIKRQADERISLIREQAARAAAEEATRRAGLLADASKVLSSSLDLSSLMVGATRVLVPALADFSAMTLVDGDSTLVRTACRPEWNLNESRIAITQAQTWVAATNEVLATGKPVSIEHFDAELELRTVAGDQENLPSQPHTAWPPQNVLFFPLIVRDKVHGVLAFGLAPANRRFSENELGLATDVASRVAIAVDNCLLFREVQKADKRKDEFLATLSHELRNPLAPMRTAIHALHLSGQWPAEAQELREMFDRQLAQLTHLVDDLLDVARITQGKIRLRIEPSDVVNEMKDALESTRSAIETAGHQLSVTLPPNSIFVMGDKVRLQQIFENLLLNACKYTELCGRIEVSILIEADDVVISVRDSGIGILPEMLPRIWELFAQVDATSERGKQGLGIGLSLVKSLVQLHGGSIQAISDGIGRGSEFVVRLPIHTQLYLAEDDAKLRKHQRSAADTSDNVPLQSRRILVVDDNVDAAESLKLLLEVYGHQVEIAYEGVTALQVAWEFRPQLIFLDVGLPGMNGHEVARRLREEMAFTDVKLIALTGYGTDSDQLRSRQAGFDRHLVKPIDPDKLPDIIFSIFQEARESPQC